MVQYKVELVTGSPAAIAIGIENKLTTWSPALGWSLQTVLPVEYEAKTSVILIFVHQ